MRLSELMGKKIINLYDGDILGTVGDSDLLIDPETGVISAIELPIAGYRRRYDHNLQIPWDSVKKVGAEVIVVEIAHHN